jgi:hypothetical protein
MKGDRNQMKAVKDDIGGALTSRRNGVKHMVCNEQRLTTRIDSCLV